MKPKTLIIILLSAIAAVFLLIVAVIFVAIVHSPSPSSGKAPVAECITVTPAVGAFRKESLVEIIHQIDAGISQPDLARHMQQKQFEGEIIQLAEGTQGDLLEMGDPYSLVRLKRSDGSEIEVWVASMSLNHRKR
jgi:hypothetical protein